jgi:hypothetical protein
VVLTLLFFRKNRIDDIVKNYMKAMLLKKWFFYFFIVR